MFAVVEALRVIDVVEIAVTVVPFAIPVPDTVIPVAIAEFEAVIVKIVLPELLIKVSHQDYSLGESMGIGTSRAFSVITDNIRGFKKIASGDVSASKALSGPIGIAQMFGGVWDWTRFWMLTGLLSMALAFMNILPIPALDGGHAVFLIYEMITGKPASDKVLERAQQVGMIILLALMAYTFGNDIFKALF